MIVCAFLCCSFWKAKCNNGNNYLCSIYFVGPNCLLIIRWFYFSPSNWLREMCPARQWTSEIYPQPCHSKRPTDLSRTFHLGSVLWHARKCSSATNFFRLIISLFISLFISFYSILLLSTLSLFIFICQSIKYITDDNGRRLPCKFPAILIFISSFFITPDYLQNLQENCLQFNKTWKMPRKLNLFESTLDLYRNSRIRKSHHFFSPFVSRRLIVLPVVVLFRCNWFEPLSNYFYQVRFYWIFRNMFNMIVQIGKSFQEIDGYLLMKSSKNMKRIEKVVIELAVVLGEEFLQ